MTGIVFYNGFLQALKEAKLDLSTGCLVVQEKLTHWPKTVVYSGSTGPMQDFQHVVGRGSTLVIVSWFDFG